MNTKEKKTNHFANDTRICNKCGEEKPSTEFYKSNKTQCKECKKEYEREKRVSIKAKRISIEDVDNLASRLKELELSIIKIQQTEIDNLKRELAISNKTISKMEKRLQI